MIDEVQAPRKGNNRRFALSNRAAIKKRHYGAQAPHFDLL